MEKKVILIGDGKKFMVKAVIKGLETDGFAVTTIYPQLDIIQSLQDSYELMILYLEDIVPVPIIKYLAALSDEKKIKFEKILCALDEKSSSETELIAGNPLEP